MYIIFIECAFMVLYAQSRDVEYKEVLTITGNFSLNGKLTNLAQYDISSGMYVGAKFCNLYVNLLANIDGPIATKPNYMCTENRMV